MQSKYISDDAIKQFSSLLLVSFSVRFWFRVIILGCRTILCLLPGLGLVGVGGGRTSRETWNNVQHVHSGHHVRVHVRDAHVTPWLAPHVELEGRELLVFCMCSIPRGLKPEKLKK